LFAAKKCENQKRLPANVWWKSGARGRRAALGGRRAALGGRRAALGGGRAAL